MTSRGPYRDPIQGPAKQEGDAIEAMWDEAVGDTRIVNLPSKLSTYPGHIERLGPRGRDVAGTTCLILRAYNKGEKQHQWHIVCYKPSELPYDPDWPRAHLKAFKTFIDNYGMKVSFCLGFAIKEDKTVHRNSCVNVRSTGDVSHVIKPAHSSNMCLLGLWESCCAIYVQRAMTDDYYDQVIDLLNNMGLAVKRDRAAKDEGLPDLEASFSRFRAT